MARSSPVRARLDSSRASSVPAQRRARLEGQLYTGETINGRRIQKFTRVECSNGRVEATTIATTDVKCGRRQPRLLHFWVLMPASPGIVTG